MPYTETRDGRRLFFERTPPRGRRRATVLLVMGFGANGRIGAPAVRRLTASGFEVLALDNRACGLSGVPWRPFTTQTMAADAIEVLDRAEVDRVHVAGASKGGMVAQEIALNFPDRVRMLILSCTTGGLPRVDLMSRRGMFEFVRLATSSVLPAARLEDRVASFLSFPVSPEFARVRATARLGARRHVDARASDGTARRRPADPGDCSPWHMVTAGSVADARTGPARHGRSADPVRRRQAAGSTDSLRSVRAERWLGTTIPERPDEVSERAREFISEHAA